MGSDADNVDTKLCLVSTLSASDPILPQEDNNIDAFIHYLNLLSPETMWFAQLICAYAALLIMMRFFAAAGLYTFIVIMIVAANIEVLKVVQFPGLIHPIALGTIFFAAAFWAVDVLTEYYGAASARKAILIGFMGSLLMLMCITSVSIGNSSSSALEISKKLHPPTSVILTPSCVRS